MINRAKMPRQLRNKGGIMNVASGTIGGGGYTGSAMGSSVFGADQAKGNLSSGNVQASLTGNVVCSGTLRELKTQIDTILFPEGIYNVLIDSSTSPISRKVYKH